MDCDGNFLKQNERLSAEGKEISFGGMLDELDKCKYICRWSTFEPDYVWNCQLYCLIIIYNYLS